MPYGLYLFDLDGTLIDSIELIYRCYRHASETHLGFSPEDEVWRTGLGTPLREQFRAVCDDAAMIEAMVVTYREHHNLHHDDAIRVYPGVAEVLGELSSRGLKLAVVTSKLRFGAERGLRRAGLLDLFETIVSADEVTRPKPDGEPVELALERLGGRSHDAVFIGDSPHDMASGRAAGVRTAGALWGPFAREELEAASADVFLESPRAILEL
jgi:pyrophosphatase PpaX